MFYLTIWRAINKIKTAAESSRAALKRENKKDHVGREDLSNNTKL